MKLKPALPELAPGVWTAFSPGGETACADGSPYVFYVRPGTVNRVVIDFEGGGACWNGATCGEGGPYQPRIPDLEGRAVGLSGLYDKSRPDNPVADWYHVFVSYCTADVHLGDSVETYDTIQGKRTVYHNGQKNVAAVPDWVLASFVAPESVSPVVAPEPTGRRSTRRTSLTPTRRPTSPSSGTAARGLSLSPS